jgi:uncharacterized membrane protein
MEINGVPLHALVVHAAVVFGPLAALTALVYAAVPRWRERFRLPMVALAVVGTLAVLAAYFSGDDLLERNPALLQKQLVSTHQDRAQLLLWLVLAFGPLAVLTGWLHTRSGPARTLAQVLLGLLALAVLVQVVLVGDAGARAVWQGL